MNIPKVKTYMKFLHIFTLFFLLFSSTFSFASTPPLYDTSTGVSVEATLDHKLLSEDGRASIKEDFKVSEIMLDVIQDTITKESYSLFNNQEEGQTGYQDSMSKALGVYEASKKLVSQYPEAAEILLDPTKEAIEIFPAHLKRLFKEQ